VIQHTKAKLFDSEILDSTRRLESLVQSQAPYHEIESEHDKLAHLVKEKRNHLFVPLDPAYFVNQFFLCSSMDQRRMKAPELAEEALAIMNSILEADEGYDSVNMQTLASIIDFFRFFGKGRAQVRAVDDASEDDKTVLTLLSLPESRLCWNSSYKISLDQLSDALSEANLISKENARYLGNHLLKLPVLDDTPLQIEWRGDSYALAAMLATAHGLGAIVIDLKETRTKDAKEAKKNTAKPQYDPSIFAFILEHFTFSKDEDQSTTYRHAECVLKEIKNFVLKVDSLRQLRLKTSSPLQKMETALKEYFENIIEVSSKNGRILEACPHLSKYIAVFRVFYALLPSKIEGEIRLR